MGKIKVISLQRSAARRSAFSEINQHLKFEFVDAVDGSTLPSATLNDRNLFMPDLGYTQGAYGNALSHLKLWDESISSDRALTICEDDAIFRLDFERRQQELVERAPAGWDLVFWGWNFDSLLSLNVLPGISPAVVLFNQDDLRNSIGAFRASNVRPKLLLLDRCLGTICYTISSQGAKKFRSLCFPLENYTIPFFGLQKDMPNVALDVAMNKFYSGTNSYACLPPLAVTRNEHGHSTVQKR